MDLWMYAVTTKTKLNKPKLYYISYMLLPQLCTFQTSLSTNLIKCILGCFLNTSERFHMYAGHFPIPQNLIVQKQ